MADEKDGALHKFLMGVEDYWVQGLNTFSTIALAALGIWLGDLPIRDVWRGVAIGAFVLAAVVFLLTTLAIYKQTPGNRSLQRQVEELEHQLEAAEDTARADYFDLFRNAMLSELAKYLGFEATERLSCYKHDGRQFVMLGRYSKNPKYNDRGRAVYPEDQGVLAAAWQRGEGYAYLPHPADERERFLEVLERDWNIDGETATGFTMPSQVLCAYAITDPNGDHVAVIVFESTRHNFLNRDDLRKVIAAENKRIAGFIEKIEPYAPTPTLAAEEGF